MKKILFCLSIGSLLLSASCKKENGALTESTWSVQGKPYTAGSLEVSAVNNLISASDAKGSSLDFSFKSIPTQSGDFTVSDASYENTNVAIRAVLGGNVVYNSFPDNGSYITLRINGGKYSVIMNNIKMVNAGTIKDTVLVSANLIEQ